VKKIFLPPFFGLALIAAILAAGNFLCPARRFSLNDLSLRWIINPGRVFVPRREAAGQELCTNSELVRLDNKSRCFVPQKSPDVFRIFCLGGSTTQGWPFQNILSYPDFLSHELKDVLPGKRVEIINAGINSSDSTSDLPLFKELLRYKPNLIFIYEGRNEVLLAPLHFGFRAKLLIPHLWLLRHVSLYNYLRRRFYPNKTFDLSDGIRRWASQSLGPNYPDIARRHMIKNLSRMIILARQDHCRVMLLTQVTDPDDPNDSPWLKGFNDSIKRLAAEEHVPVADTAKAFDSYHGGLGPIFLHRLWHPDVGGYFLISQTALHALARSGLLAPNRDWRWNQEKSELTYLRELSVTPKSLAATYLFLRFVCVSIERANPPLRSQYQSMPQKYAALAHALWRRGWAGVSVR